LGEEGGIYTLKGQTDYLCAKQAALKPTRQKFRIMAERLSPGQQKIRLKSLIGVF